MTEELDVQTYGIRMGPWETFNALLDSRPPLIEGEMGFYYTDSEILPPYQLATIVLSSDAEMETF
ncbi:hypothetical protein KC19_VG177700 [Ceratodon purpureus]|uniref:Uncharacterized protein n=1 Tax=Ceratodon purpureus TaxID=3225 RepID=A0A8T0HRR6_CERPU|nr:hypothetical protein KC19_VG177700 [Ceratodon purpureus]